MGTPTALSPELDGRLKRQFPAGTPETALVAELTRHGFQLEQQCPDDRSIRSASFRRGDQPFNGGMLATISWKVDGLGRVVWTRGSVRYNGL